MCKLIEAGEIGRKRSKVEFEDQKDPEKTVRKWTQSHSGKDHILYLRGHTVHLLQKEEKEIRCIHICVGKDYISKQKDQRAADQKIVFSLWSWRLT